MKWLPDRAGKICDLKILFAGNSIRLFKIMVYLNLNMFMETEITVLFVTEYVGGWQEKQY